MKMFMKLFQKMRSQTLDLMFSLLIDQFRMLGTGQYVLHGEG